MNIVSHTCIILHAARLWVQRAFGCFNNQGAAKTRYPKRHDPILSDPIMSPRRGTDNRERFCLLHRTTTDRVCCGDLEQQLVRSKAVQGPCHGHTLTVRVRSGLGRLLEPACIPSPSPGCVQPHLSACLRVNRCLARRAGEWLIVDRAYGLCQSRNQLLLPSRLLLNLVNTSAQAPASPESGQAAPTKAPQPS